MDRLKATNEPDAPYAPLLAPQPSEDISESPWRRTALSLPAHHSRLH